MQEKETLDEKLPGLFEPDTLLPIQYFEAMRRKHLLEGEKRLVLSVLEDAVECFMKCIDSSTNKGQRLFRDAEEWITLEDKKWVFSFDNVCEMLDVNPEYLRRGLRDWKIRKLEAIERAHIARTEQEALAAAQPVAEEPAAPMVTEEVATPMVATPMVAKPMAAKPMAAKPMIAKSAAVKPGIGANHALQRKGAPSDRRAKLRKARA